VPPQPELRRGLERLGGPEVSRWLEALDPSAAGKIDPRNVRRVIRALEVTLVTGRRMSEIQSKTPPSYQITVIGLTAEREYLYRHVDERVDRMIADGLLDEVTALRNRGYGPEYSSMSGLGYRQLMAYLEGDLTLDEAIERIKYETHRFIRQQYTWFRLDNQVIHWFDVVNAGWEEDVLRYLKQRLANDL
jgi:tRNA dimethylallyltransferase